MPEEPAGKRLDFLDALRGWAVLGVLMVHCSIAVQTLEAWKFLIGQGRFGVQLFFVVSAFTLCWVTQFIHKNDVTWVPFFWRRFFRIAPMYYLAIILFAVVYVFGAKGGLWQYIMDNLVYWTAGSDQLTFGNLVANFAFIHGFYPYWITSLVPGGWFIAVVFGFYLIFPFLFKLASNVSRAAILFLISVVIAVVLRMLCLPLNPIDSEDLWRAYLYMWYPSQLPVFLLGIVSFHIYLLLIRNVSRPGMLKAASILFFAVGALICAANLLEFKFFGIPRHWIYAVGFAGILLALSVKPAKVLVNSWTIRLGRISYSLYLLHWFAICLVATLGNALLGSSLDDVPVIKYLMTYTLVLLLAGAISTVTWKQIELRGIELGRLVTARPGRVSRAYPA